MPSTLRVAVEDTLGSPAPDAWCSLADLQAGRLVYDTLVQFETGLRCVPAVARGWHTSKNGREWHFRLDPRRKFHDGTPVDSAAVCWNMRERLVPRFCLQKVVERVSATGPHEVSVLTADPFAPMLAYLGSPQAGLMAPQSGAGCGTHRIESWSSGGVRLERVTETADNPGTRYSQIRFVPLAHGEAMWTALCDGNVDVLYECPYELVRRGGMPPDIVVRSCSSLSVNLLLFNCSDGPFAANDLRQAVGRVVDRNQLCREANGGVGKPAIGPLSPGSPFYSRSHGISTRTNDPGARRQTASVRILAQPNYNRRWLRLFATQLGAAAVCCEFEFLPLDEMMQRLRKGNYQAALIGVGGTPDPDTMLSPLFHTRGAANFARISDGPLDGLLSRARATLDTAKRRTLYRAVLGRLSQLTPAIFLRHGASIVGHRRSVGGLIPHPDNCLRLEHATPFVNQTCKEVVWH